MKNDSDPLGTRIKEQYENRTRYYVPRRTYTILRLDGCHFRTYTRGLKKPFDKHLYEDMDNAIIAMLPEIQGAVFAYTQSDEISILLTDFATPQTSAWFDGNIQKMASVSASLLTAEFNSFRHIRHMNDCMENGTEPSRSGISLAYFDSRVFSIPDRVEVMNMLIWRNQDCSRNSVSMVAQSLYSHKELMGKSSVEQQEMIHDKGVSWVNDFSAGEKNGRLIIKETYLTDIQYKGTTLVSGTNGVSVGGSAVQRTRWVSKGAWKFTEDKEKLLAMIPQYEP